MMNTELFRKIDKDITLPGGIGIDYNRFEMAGWEESEPECGTTRCVAGWAIYETTGQPLYTDGGSRHSEATVELAKRLGAQIHSVEGVEHVDLEDLAAKVLGLDREDRVLFYTDEHIAAEFVRLAAEGKHEAASASLLDEE